jgi:hypothetical protein
MQDTVEETIELIEAQRRQVGELNAAGIRADVEVTPLEFLHAVYRSEALPLAIRMRAAIEAAPYVHPKLSATATVSMDGDFAMQLERAIKRSEAVRLIGYDAATKSCDAECPIGWPEANETKRSPGA